MYTYILKVVIVKTYSPKAKDKVMQMNDTDFINATMPQYTGYDIY